MRLLEVQNLRVHYGAIRAVEDVSLHVEAGEIVALIGANGAGKSSTLRAIVGLVPVSAGSIQSPQGAAIGGRSTHWIATRCRIAWVPEGRGVFTRMTVEENLELGAYSQRARGRAWVRQSLQRVYALFPRLLERRTQLAGTLSGGEQQMLAIGRALVGEPRLLLLDEPSLGLAPQVVKQLFDQFESIKQAGTSILLVEQNSLLALNVSNRAYVLDRGSIVLDGPSQDLARDDRVRQAYLGLAAVGA